MVRKAVCRTGWPGMSDANTTVGRFVLRQAPAVADEEQALLDATFGLSRRTQASYRLREGAEPVAGLSFHAIEKRSGRLAGVISFWPLRTWPGGRQALLLGPLAVHPDFQNDGLGSLLMRTGLRAAEEAGHGLVLLVGDAPYYGRHGFAPVPAGQLQLPGPFEPQRLLYRELVPGALQGVDGLLLPEWRYHQLRERHGQRERHERRDQRVPGERQAQEQPRAE